MANIDVLRRQQQQYGQQVQQYESDVGAYNVKVADVNKLGSKVNSLRANGGEITSRAQARAELERRAAYASALAEYEAANKNLGTPPSLTAKAPDMTVADRDALAGKVSVAQQVNAEPSKNSVFYDMNEDLANKGILARTLYGDLSR